MNYFKFWENLKKSVGDEYSEQFYLSSDKEVEENHEINLSKPRKTCKNCTICCYNVLIKYNPFFFNAYPTLSTAYQHLLTLPMTQIAFERSFSILNYLKNRLRNSNEYLILIWC